MISTYIYIYNYIYVLCDSLLCQGCGPQLVVSVCDIDDRRSRLQDTNRFKQEEHSLRIQTFCLVTAPSTICVTGRLATSIVVSIGNHR